MKNSEWGSAYPAAGIIAENRFGNGKELGRKSIGWLKKLKHFHDLFYRRSLLFFVRFSRFQFLAELAFPFAFQLRFAFIHTKKFRNVILVHLILSHKHKFAHRLQQNNKA